MPVLEILFTHVSTAIVRKVVQLWIEDPDFSLEIASDWGRLFSQFAINTITSSKVSRHFTLIQEKTAESLEKILTIEAGNFEEQQIEAITSAIGDTIDKVTLSREIVFKSNLNAEELSKYFLENKPANVLVGLSSDEINLYERMLIEASNFIIEITASMPRFHEKAIAEIFDRETEIVELLTAALTKIEQMWEANQGEATQNKIARFEEAYRRAAARNLDRMELFGAGAFVRHKRYQLSVAYISLSVSGVSKNESEDDAWDTVRVEKALSTKNKLLILGDAGSGKTTLLQWIGVQAASRTFSGELESWNDKIPFLILLRGLADKSLPTPEQFPELVSPSISGQKPKEWVSSLLSEGKAIILIDGVDEVDDRISLRDWIQDLTNNYENTGNVFIVSSRPTAIDEGWLTDFHEATLQSMETPDIYEFIDHWHDAIELEVQDIEQRAKLPELAQNIKLVIQETKTIRNLATNPLLCALLCALHRDMNQKLPSGRRELYDACLHMLIERRDEERSIILKHYPHLDYRQKITLLRDLAYHMMDTDSPEIDMYRAADRIKWRLGNMQGIVANVNPQAALSLLLDRTGIIREPSTGRIDFTHRTFEEYLAALEIHDQGNRAKLVDKVTDDKWREVIILAAGIFSSVERDKLIQEIIAVGDKTPTYATQCYLLAFSCLETVVDKPSQAIEDILNKRIQTTLPPKNMEEAQAVANAGAIAIKYLGHYAQQNIRASEAAACIRALALIASTETSSDDVLRELERFVPDQRITVIKELIRARSEFDPKEYGKRVLSNLILEYANLSYANLQEANLQGVNLQGADLVQADLVQANLQGANLQGANLRDANLQYADLRNAKLQGASLQGANLEGATHIDEALFNEYTVLPTENEIRKDQQGNYTFLKHWTPETDMARYTDPEHPEFVKFHYSKSRPRT